MLKLSERSTIIKNLLAANISFLFVFAAVNSSATVQPTLNQDGNLGVASQATLYAAEIFTALVIPAIVCEQLGFKWSLVIGELCFFTYIACQAYPKWATLIPSSIFSGFGNSLCWYVIGVYVTLLSKQYAQLNSLTFVEVQTFFFGVSGCIFMLSYFVGAAQIALILQQKDLNPNETQTNQSYNYAASCGANNCPNTPFASKSVSYTTESTYWLCAALDVLMLLAILTTVFFMDNIKVDDTQDQKTKELKKNSLCTKITQNFKNEFSELFKLYKKLDVWLLLPITMYTGFELTFIWFEFSRAFGSCLKGLTYVGWANIAFGLLASLASFFMGIILKYIGTPAGIVLMLSTSFTQCIFIISWTAKADDFYVIFFMVIGYTISQSVAQAQVRGLYGVYFPGQPAAFSAATLAQTIGLFLGSFFSIFFCTRLKTLIFAAIILASLLCYFWMIIKNANNKKIQDSDEKEPISDESEPKKSPWQINQISENDPVIEM